MSLSKDVCYTVKDAVDWYFPPTARRFYKDVIFDTSRSPEKCIKIAKTAGNKAFLAVFAVLVVVQLAPLRPQPEGG